MSVAWVGAGIAAVGTIGGIINGGKAGDAQRQAASDATAETRREFDVNQGNIKPFRDAGLSVLPQLTSGLATGGDFNRDFTLADFQKDPGYQFRMDQGQQGLERGAAARGGLLSGGTLKALSRYGQDYASGEYSNAYNRFNADRTTRFNRLSALAGTGQTATNQIANLGADASRSISENILGAGNARAASYVNTGNQINNGISTLGNFYLQQQYGRNNSSGGGGGGGGVPYTPGYSSPAPAGGYNI